MNLLIAMRVYVRVVELGSMSEAARDTGLSPTTVYGWMDRLERHLKVRLLIRRPRNMLCTTIGLNFYEKSKRVLALVDATDKAMSDKTTASRVEADTSFN